LEGAYAGLKATCGQLGFKRLQIGYVGCRLLGGLPEIMGIQLGKLMEVAGRPGFVIQVVPLTAINCPCADGPMTIFEMPDGTQTGYVEGSEVGRIIEAPNEVAKLRARFDLLRVAALPPAESVNLIREIRDAYGE
jgi:hypothetical protein